jgi:hypothetical protein
MSNMNTQAMKKNKRILFAGLMLSMMTLNVHAKLPPAPPQTEEQKAEAAAKAKAAADKEAALLEKYQDKAADRYKKTKAATKSVAKDAVKR